MQGAGVKLEKKPPEEEKKIPMPVSEEITKGRLEVTGIEGPNCELMLNKGFATFLSMVATEGKVVVDKIEAV